MREIARPLLAERTTLRLGGPALAELLPENEEDARALPERVRHWGGRPFVIGAGSNLLVRDEAQPLTLIRPLFARGRRLSAKTTGACWCARGRACPCLACCVSARRRNWAAWRGLWAFREAWEAPSP